MLHGRCQRSLLLLNFIINTSNNSVSVINPTSSALSPNNTIIKHRRTMSSEDSLGPAKYTVSYVTTPDEKIAKEIAHKLVSNKLAACVNIVPQVTSIYVWGPENKVNEDHESMMIIKTTAAKTDALIKFVKENHPYSVAEVISMPIIKGNEPYLDWVEKSVADGQ